jgi:DNA primase
MPGINFNLLREQITMVEVLDQLGFKAVSRSGDQCHGPCPVHGSSSPKSTSLSVNLRTRRYYCHKCQSKGNQLELWAAAQKMTIYEAAQDLCRALNREIPWIHSWPGKKEQKRRGTGTSSFNPTSNSSPN